MSKKKSTSIRPFGKNMLFLVICILAAMFSASITSHWLYSNYGQLNNIFIPVPIDVKQPPSCFLGQSQNYPDLIYAAETGVNSIVKISIARSTAPNTSKRNWLYTLLMPFTPSTSSNHVGGGAGVIIGSEGYIVTNNHVVKGASVIKITLNDERIYFAEIVGTDNISDLALLKIECNDLPAIPWGDSEALHLGEWVLAIGSPLGLQNTVTAGIISAKGRNLNHLMQHFNDRYIQTDATINVGNSGGGLININGELVGIPTIIKSQTNRSSGYSFAIPTSIIKRVISDIEHYGAVRYTIQGFSFVEINDYSIPKLGVTEKQGLYVIEIDSLSNIYNAGIQPQDIILKVENSEVTSTESFLKEIFSSSNKSIILSVKRLNKVVPVTISCKSRL